MTETGELRNSTARPDEIVELLKRFKNRFTITYKQLVYKEELNNDDVFVLDSPTQGILDVNYLGVDDESEYYDLEYLSLKNWGIPDKSYEFYDLTASGVEMPKNNHSLYFKFSTSSDIRQRLFSYASTVTSGYIDIDNSSTNNKVIIESYTESDWTADVDITGIDLADGNEHKVYIEFKSDSTNIYIDNILFTTTANNDSAVDYFKYLYVATTTGGTYTYELSYTGTISEPIILYGTLSEDLRNQLFEGELF